MKKKSSLIVAIVLMAVMALTGCGGNSEAAVSSGIAGPQENVEASVEELAEGNGDGLLKVLRSGEPTSEEQAKGVIEGLLGALSSADYARLAEYVPMDEQDKAELEKMCDLLEDRDALKGFFSELMGPEMEEYPYMYDMMIDPMMDMAFEYLEEFENELIKSYTVGDAEVEGDQATVPAAVTLGFDPELLQSIDWDGLTDEILTEWAETAMDEGQLYEFFERNEGADEDTIMMEYCKQTALDTARNVLDRYEEKILGTGQTTWNIDFKVSKVDDKWLLSGADCPELQAALGE